MPLAAPTAPTAHVVDTIDDEHFADLAELAALVSGATWACVSLLDSAGARRGAEHGVLLPDGSPPFAGTPCELVMAGGAPVVLHDAVADGRYLALAELTGKRGYAGVPVREHGQVVGTVCVAFDTPLIGAPSRILRGLDRVAAQVPRQLASQRRLLALDGQEDALRTIVAALPGGLLLQDGEGHTLAANPALCRMLDLPDPESVIGTTRDELRALIRSSPVGLQALLKTTTGAVESGIAVAAREMDLPDGRRLEWDYLPMKLAGGRERRLWHVRDVTARHITDKRLEAAERRFATLAAAGSTAGVFQLDDTGAMLFMDSVCRALFGAADGEAPPSEWWDFIHAEDRDRVVAAWTEAFARQVHYSVGYRVVTAAGTVKRVDVEAAPMHDGDGDFMGFVGTMTDITDHVDAVLARESADALARREHQRLSDLVAGSPEPILSISPDGRILGMNPAGLATFAMTRQEAVGRPLTDLVSGADRSYLRSMVEQVLHEGHRNQPVEVLAVGARPRMFLAQIVLIPMRAPGGADSDAVALTAIFRDVSDHHRAEVEHLKRLEGERAARVAAEGAQAVLEARLEELHAVTRAKDAFVAMISHELRTPLTSIRTFAEFLAEDTPDDDAPPAVIVRNVERLERIVGDLLVVKAGIEASTLELEPMDLRALLRHEVTALRPAALAAGVTLEAVDGPPVPVAADRARLGQVIGNLVDNALKFTPAGQRIALRADARAGGVTLEVRDTGCGIAIDELPRVFERFYQGGAGRALARGSGLGLAIAALIAEAHGGQMDVSSKVGVGTTFTMTLPTGL
jgi:PAS domain S-box-containing protein